MHRKIADFLDSLCTDYQAQNNNSVFCSIDWQYIHKHFGEYCDVLSDVLINDKSSSLPVFAMCNWQQKERIEENWQTYARIRNDEAIA